MTTLRLLSSIICVAPLLWAGCATSRALAPLEKGQSAVNLSLGGPFVQYGSAPVPVPITAVGYRYGIDGKTDVHAGFFPTGAFALGVAAFDVGVSREALDAHGAVPRIMFDFNTTWMGGDNAVGGPKGGFRFFPEVAMILTWEMGAAKHKVYVGADAFLQPFPTFHAIFTPILGTELMASKVVGIQLELNWVQPSKNTYFAVPVWYGPGNQGAISAKVGVDIRIPRGKKHAQPPPDAPEAEVDPDAPEGEVPAQTGPSDPDVPFGPIAPAEPPADTASEQAAVPDVSEPAPAEEAP